MRRTATLIITLVVSAQFSSPSFAWIRPRYEDATVVERSELIVVAHLKKGTIQYVPHEKRPHEGSSWEHHAVLVVTKVLKGKCDEKEIPIIIHYGLTPIVGGYVKRDNFMIDNRAGRDDYPKDIIEIFDTGNSIHGLPPLVKDAGEHNLWFLRRRTGTFGRKPGNGKLGIVDPEDLQPLEWRDYFLTYMADNPENAVRQYAKKNPERAGRAKSYLDHLEVQRILEIEDPAERYERLLPYFLSSTTWNMKCEARQGIISCGRVAGERLKEIFDDPERATLRQGIILLWRDIGYEEAVPLLIGLLKKHDRYWATQKLQKDWWNNDVNSELTRQRRDIYGEVYYGICALRAFEDPQARAILETTRDRWEAIDFDNPQIVEECEAALRELPEREGSA